MSVVGRDLAKVTCAGVDHILSKVHSAVSEGRDAWVLVGARPTECVFENVPLINSSNKFSAYQTEPARKERTWVYGKT